MFSKKSLLRAGSVLFIFASLISLEFSSLNTLRGHAAGTLYVTAAGTGNCSDWEHACMLQTALATASAGDEIWASPITPKTQTMCLSVPPAPPWMALQ